MFPQNIYDSIVDTNSSSKLLQINSSPLSQQFISTHHLPATNSVKTALKALVDKLLVSKTPNGYLVSDRFFAKWLVRGGIIAN